MTSEQFIEEYLLKEVKQIEAANVRLHLLMAMLHGVETAGAFLDSKPFKVKGQGKKRFDLAIQQLFPKSYPEVNLHFNLYQLLRSHMAHCMLPAKLVCIGVDERKHLVIEDNVVGFSIDAFYQDYISAITRLLGKHHSGDLKKKRIVFGNLHLSTTH